MGSEMCIRDRNNGVDVEEQKTSAGNGGGVSVAPSSKSSMTSPIARLENRHFPQFSVEGLAPGKAFGMVVYAQNTKVIIKKGRK